MRNLKQLLFLSLLSLGCSDSPTAPPSTALDGRVFYSLNHVHPTLDAEATLLESWTFADTGEDRGRYRFEERVVDRVGDIGLPLGQEITFWSNGEYRLEEDGTYGRIMREGEAWDRQTNSMQPLEPAGRPNSEWVDWGDRVLWGGRPFQATDREGLAAFLADLKE